MLFNYHKVKLATILNSLYTLQQVKARPISLASTQNENTIQLSPQFDDLSFSIDNSIDQPIIFKESDKVPSILALANADYLYEDGVGILDEVDDLKFLDDEIKRINLQKEKIKQIRKIHHSHHDHSDHEHNSQVTKNVVHQTQDNVIEMEHQSNLIDTTPTRKVKDTIAMFEKKLIDVLENLDTPTTDQKRDRNARSAPEPEPIDHVLPWDFLTDTPSPYNTDLDLEHTDLPDSFGYQPYFKNNEDEQEVQNRPNPYDELIEKINQANQKYNGEYMASQESKPKAHDLHDTSSSHTATSDSDSEHQVMEYKPIKQNNIFDSIDALLNDIHPEVQHTANVHHQILQDHTNLLNSLGHTDSNPPLNVHTQPIVDTHTVTSGNFAQHAPILQPQPQIYYNTQPQQHILQASSQPQMVQTHQQNQHVYAPQTQVKTNPQIHTTVQQSSSLVAQPQQQLHFIPSNGVTTYSQPTQLLNLGPDHPNESPKTKPYSASTLTFEDFYNNIWPTMENNPDHDDDLDSSAIQARNSPVTQNFQEPQLNLPLAPRQFGDNFEDSEFVKSLDPSLAKISGEPFVNSFEYFIDGNYKLTMRIHANIPLKFDELAIGKCGLNNPGLMFVNYETFSLTVMVDLSICKKVCDEHPNTFLSATDPLNSEIDVYFKTCDKFSGLCAEYDFKPTGDFLEDYILDFDTSTGIVEQIGIDENGNYLNGYKNLEFTFNTYHDQEFKQQKENKAINHINGEKTYIAIEPYHGFNAAHMLTIPEICLISDDYGHERILWDLAAVSNGNRDSCYKDMRLQVNHGLWQFAAEISPGEKISCNVRLCANVPGNLCEQVVQTCDYA